MENKYDYKKTKVNPTKFSFEVAIKKADFLKEKEEVFKKLSKDIEVQGFRPGKAPRTILEAKLGPKLYEETINQIFPRVASEIISTEQLNPVSQVQYTLKKVSEEDGLEFSFEVEAIEKIVLPDFSSLKVKKDPVEIKKQDIESVIEDMIERESANNSQKAQDPKDKKDKAQTTSKPSETKEKIKPTDEWAKSLKIDGVDNIEELKGKIKEQLEIQKKQISEEKYLSELVDLAVEKAHIAVPEALVTRQAEASEKNYKSRIENLGLDFDTFLKTKKIKIDEMREGWKKEAQKRISREILLVEVAKANNLKVAQEEIEKEIAVIKDPKIKEQYSSSQGKDFIASVIIQQKAVNLIKEQAEGKSQK